jgi:hypothetical protein
MRIIALLTAPIRARRSLCPAMPASSFVGPGSGLHVRRRSPAKRSGRRPGALIRPASCVSCVPARYWANSAEHHEKVHLESGMRYQVSSSPPRFTLESGPFRVRGIRRTLVCTLTGSESRRSIWSAASVLIVNRALPSSRRRQTGESSAIPMGRR